MDSPYRIIHPIPEAKRTRTRPLEILCLGLSRSGTESLKQAFEILGYKKVYHGFHISDSSSDALIWCRLSFTKTSHEPSGSSLFTAHLFDRVIGDCYAPDEEKL
jgi:hypothetical protein